MIEATGPVAVTSGSRSVQFVSPRSSLNCTRYFAPEIALQASVAWVPEQVTDWMTGRASTVTTKVLVVLTGGELLSVTITEMLLVLGPCASVGVQRKMPVAGFTLALVGAPMPRV